MYIFELAYKLLNKLLNKKKSKKTDIPYLQEDEYYELEDDKNCEHVFMPIDSTKKILACAKCGLVIKNKNIKIKPPVNFFSGY